MAVPPSLLPPLTPAPAPLDTLASPLPPLPPLPLPPLPLLPPPTSSHALPAPLLVIGIPSMRRHSDPTYVLRTLQYLIEQTSSINGTGVAGAVSDVPGPHPLRIRVLVMDNTRAPGTHAAFESAVERFCGRNDSSSGGRVWGGSEGEGEGQGEGEGEGEGGSEGRLAPCARYSHGEHTLALSANGIITFAWNGRARVWDGEDAGNDNFPGARVRAQSRDVVALLDLASALFPPPAMAAYMLLEDDFRVCPMGLQALALLMARATTMHTPPAPWNALRVSYGLNGGILRGEDVSVFAGYLSEHLARRPPDHLWVEWFAGERPQSQAHKRGRPHIAFRYNVLEHFGASSSLRDKASPRYALCYEELTEGVVFEVEAFKPGLCPHDILWPCWPQGDARYAALWAGDAPGGDAGQPYGTTAGIPFPELAARAAADSVQTYALW